MSKMIEFKYQDIDYCLEYNREAVKLMEQQGFDMQEFTKKPMTMGDLAFQGAFIKNHRNIKVQKINEIYDSLNDKSKLLVTLLEMVQETYEDLYSDNKDEKNIEWKIV